MPLRSRRLTIPGQAWWHDLPSWQPFTEVLTKSQGQVSYSCCFSPLLLIGWGRGERWGPTHQRERSWNVCSPRELGPNCIVLIYYSCSCFFQFFYCLDITCPVPPNVPTSVEYVLPSDDGTAVIQSVIYPTTPNVIRNDMVFNSSHNGTEFPRNYLTNIM